MHVIDTVAGLRGTLAAERDACRRVGLVPTMGSLHAGHTSLVERAAAECDVVIVTVFVNPLQFGPSEDLGGYPRDLERDAAMAEEHGAGIVFAPPVAEMYPDGAPATTVTVAGLSDVLEGACRPGHLTGVATVVAKLFNLAGPCRAYFGEKDFQQLAVVRRLAVDLSFPVDVVGCPTVRDTDGLALSSRNVYLAADDRRAATVLHRALLAGRDLIERGGRDVAAIGRCMADVVATEPRAVLDYAEVVDPGTLHRPDLVAGTVRLLLAARIGTTRLIDNLGVEAP